MFGRLKVIEESLSGKQRLVHDKSNLIVNNSVSMMKDILGLNYLEGINSFVLGMLNWTPTKNSTDLGVPGFFKAPETKTVIKPVTGILEFERQPIFTGKITTQDGINNKIFTVNFDPSYPIAADVIEILEGPNTGSWTVSSIDGDSYTVIPTTLVFDDVERNARAYKNIASNVYPGNPIARIITSLDFTEGNEFGVAGYKEACLAIDYTAEQRILREDKSGITHYDGDLKRIRTSDSVVWEEYNVQPGDKLMGVSGLSWYVDPFHVDYVDGIDLYLVEDFPAAHTNLSFLIYQSSGEVFAIQSFNTIYKTPDIKLIFEWQIGFTNPGFPL